MPTVTGARGKTVKAKVVTPKGAESMRTYYQADPYAEQPNNVKTTRASKCPPGWTGTRPPWFSKKK
jgi:hypothetical protein